MYRARGVLWASTLLAVVALLAAACGPAAEPTATTAPAQPTATTAPALPTATTVMEEVKLRPVPVVARPAPNPEAQYGGTFRWLWHTSGPRDFSTPENISHFYTSQAWDSLLQNNIYEVYAGPGAAILPSLAYDWWTDQSGLEWTFKLREDVQFSDGQPFTCADAKFTLDLARFGQDATGAELRSSPRGGLLTRVDEVLCPDDHTLTITTDGPMPALAAALTSTNFAIMPKHVFEGNLRLLLEQLGPGTGPFLFEEYLPTESLTYTRNPNYWDQPYPYLDKMHHVITGSIPSALAAYRVGRGEQYYYTFPPRSAREEMIAAGRLVVEPMRWSQGLTYMQANWTRTPWNDPRISLALRCAIDGQKAIDTGRDGEGIEAAVFPAGNQPGGSDLSITTEEWMSVGPCHGPANETNMEERRQIARQLLADMGFGPGNPPRPLIPVQSNNEEWPSIQDDLMAAGFDPQVEFMDSSSIRLRFAEGNFDILHVGIASNFLDPDFYFYEVFYSTSDRNYGRYTNPEMDALIDEQSKTLDQEKRRELIKELQLMILRENPNIRYAYNVSIPNGPPWLKDHRMLFPFTQSTWQQMKAVWIDQEILARLGG